MGPIIVEAINKMDLIVATIFFLLIAFGLAGKWFFDYPFFDGVKTGALILLTIGQFVLFSWELTIGQSTLYGWQIALFNVLVGIVNGLIESYRFETTFLEGYLHGFLPGIGMIFLLGSITKRSGTVTNYVAYSKSSTPYQ